MGKAIFDNQISDLDNLTSHNRKAYPESLLAAVDDAIQERKEIMSGKEIQYKKPSNNFIRQLNSIVSILEGLTDFKDEKAHERKQASELTESQKKIKTEMHVNGKLKYKGNMKNCVYHGRGFLCHYNGNLMYKGNFEEGEIESDNCEIFHFNGNLQYTGEIIKGIYEGVGKQYHENGCLKYEGDFVHGMPVGPDCMIFYDNGNSEYKGPIFDGKYTGYGSLFHKNGNLEYEGVFVNDGADGNDCVLYHENGNISYKGSIKSGLFDGYGELRSRTGVTEYKGNFLDGKPIANKNRSLGKSKSEDPRKFCLASKKAKSVRNLTNISEDDVEDDPDLLSSVEKMSGDDQDNRDDNVAPYVYKNNFEFGHFPDDETYYRYKYRLMHTEDSAKKSESIEAIIPSPVRRRPISCKSVSSKKIPVKPKKKKIPVKPKDREMMTFRKPAGRDSIDTRKVQVVKAAIKAMDDVQDEKEKRKILKATKKAMDDVQDSKYKSNVLKAVKKAMDDVQDSKDKANVLKAVKKTMDDIQDSKDRRKVLIATKKGIDDIHDEKDKANVLIATKKTMDHVQDEKDKEYALKAIKKTMYNMHQTPTKQLYTDFDAAIVIEDLNVQDETIIFNEQQSSDINNHNQEFLEAIHSLVKDEVKKESQKELVSCKLEIKLPTQVGNKPQTTKTDKPIKKSDPKKPTKPYQRRTSTSDWKDPQPVSKKLVTR